MPRRGTLGRLALAGAALSLLVAGCIAPLAPGLMRRPETLPAGRLGVSVSAAAYVDNPQTFTAAPDVALGLRHRLGDGVDGGLALSLDSGLVADVQVEVHPGPGLVIAVDPRLTLTPPLTRLLVPGAASSVTGVGATVPLTFGVPLGESELIFGPTVNGGWAHTASGDAWLVMAGGGVGVDLAVGPVFLVPEVDVLCGVAGHPLRGNGAGCLGYLAVSFHD